MSIASPHVHNGTYQIHPNNPSLATVQCNSGFIPVGAVVSQLLPDVHGVLAWIPPQLVCEPMISQAVPDVQNGTLESVKRHDQSVQPPYQSHDTVLPKCYPGYEFQGTRAILLPNHENSFLIWTPSTLVCKPMQTEQLPDVEHGTLQRDRTLPDAEYASPKSLALHDHVNLTCDPGYTSKQFSSTLRVDPQNHLVWDPPLLACEPMTLLTQPRLVNGVYRFEKPPPYYMGDRAEIDCYPGFRSDYDKSYAEVIERGRRLVWYPPTLHCQPMTLDTLPDVEKGTVSLQPNAPYPYRLGTRATITCDPEHVAAVTESMIQIDPHTGHLQWVPEQVRCQRVNCPEPPPAPVSGSKEGNGREFLDRIKYTCPPDYEVVGEQIHRRRFEPVLHPEFQCHVDGNWVPELPKSFQCEKAYCPALQKPEWTYLEYSRVQDGVATYTCALDKTVVTRMCQADQTWSGEEPKCPKPQSILSNSHLIWILSIFLLLCFVVFFMIRTDPPKAPSPKAYA